MDITEFINESLQKQKEELVENEKEEKVEKKKLDIWKVLEAIAKKDIEFYNNLSEDEKKLLQPYVVNLWLSMIYSKNDSKKLDDIDIVYHELLLNVNNRINANLFDFPSKELFWLVATTINEFYEFIPKFNVNYIKGKKSNKEKYNKEVLEFLSDELMTSTNKIVEMIESGYISNDLLKEVEAVIKSKQSKIK
jgi:hypothetical protein